jgi:hypothetical protein
MTTDECWQATPLYIRLGRLGGAFGYAGPEGSLMGYGP